MTAQGEWCWRTSRGHAELAQQRNSRCLDGRMRGNGLSVTVRLPDSMACNAKQLTGVRLSDRAACYIHSHLHTLLLCAAFTDGFSLAWLPLQALRIRGGKLQHTHQPTSPPSRRSPPARPLACPRAPHPKPRQPTCTHPKPRLPVHPPKTTARPSAHPPNTTPARPPTSILPKLTSLLALLLCGMAGKPLPVSASFRLAPKAVYCRR